MTALTLTLSRRETGLNWCLSGEILWKARVAHAAGQPLAIQIIQHRQGEFPRRIEHVFELHAFQPAFFLKMPDENLTGAIHGLGMEEHALFHLDQTPVLAENFDYLLNFDPACRPFVARFLRCSADETPDLETILQSSPIVRRLRRGMCCDARAKPSRWFVSTIRPSFFKPANQAVKHQFYQLHDDWRSCPLPIPGLSGD